MMRTIRVHPVADLFPMMSDDEIADLAEDIKENGLIHPIIVNDDGVLIDGRNRAKACEIAGVEPRIEKFNGGDPRAFILAANIKRRHMSKGQQAMAHAMIFSEAAKLKRKGSGSFETKDQGFSEGRLSMARTILASAPDLARGILAGSERLDKAYETVRRREGEADNHAARLRDLKKERPDLADLVGDEKRAASARRQPRQQSRDRRGLPVAGAAHRRNCARIEFIRDGVEALKASDLQLGDDRRQVRSAPLDVCRTRFDAHSLHLGGEWHVPVANAAELDAATLGGCQGGLGALRDHAGFVLGDRRQDVDGQAIGLREVGGLEVDA